MKNLLYLFLLFCSISLNAQISFPDSSAIWNISTEGNGGCVNNTYSINGDTLIKSYKYKKLYASNDTIFNFSNSKYYCAVRETHYINGIFYLKVILQIIYYMILMLKLETL